MTKIETAEELLATGITADPRAQGIVSLAALIANVVVLTMIIVRAKKMHINPYTKDVWVGTKDFEEAMERAEK